MRGPVIRIRIVRSPNIADVDGIALDAYRVGDEYELGNSLAGLFLAEGWAEPVALDAPGPPEPFSADDPFGTSTLDRNSPPNLVKEQVPPFLERDLAHDFVRHWRRRRRRRA
jgi:hypothetical protein